MLVIGLTGGIASGKSTVSHLLSSRHHLEIVDADILAREVVQRGTTGYTQLVNHFGADRILLPDGDLDRAAIGDIVFHDPDERKWINGVIHPRVRKEMVWRVLRAWVRGQWAVVLDVPLLVEAGMWKWVGEVVVVFVNERLQTSRLLARASASPSTSLTPAQASARISSQMPLSTKLSYATSVLDNSGSLSDLTAQVDNQVAKWKKQQGGSSGWWWRVCMIPPVGLTAGALCLLTRWWSELKGPRRRARGEVERKRGEGKGERIELSEIRGGAAGGRRRGTSGSGSLTDED